MDAFFQLLSEWGYGGMFIAAFLAGSVLPFNSETLMAALFLAKLNPWGLIFWGTLGNVLGSVFNYYIGCLGKMEWIERWLKVKPEKLQKAQRWVAKYGAWMGLLAWIPLLGSAITVALGLMRSNAPLTFTAITIGKLVRYILVIYGTSLFV